MTALQTLSELDRAAKAKYYPSVPLHALPKKAFSDASANGLTQCILQWLKLNGCYATRVTSAGRYLEKEQKWIPGTVRKGTADIHAVIAGKHASIEVKIRRDRMSEAQEQTRQEVEASGGFYFIARDFEGFYQWYRQLFDPSTNHREAILAPKNRLNVSSVPKTVNK